MSLAVPWSDVYVLCPPPSACILGDRGGVGGCLVVDELDDGIALGAGDCGRDLAAGG